MVVRRVEESPSQDTRMSSVIIIINLSTSKDIILS